VDPITLGLLAAAGLFVFMKKGKSTSSASAASSMPSDDALETKAAISNTGLAPWKGQSGKDWQQAVSDAIASHDPGKMAATAEAMRLDGLISQSEELDRYAGGLTAKAAVVNASIAQTTAILQGKEVALASELPSSGPPPRTGIAVSASLHDAAKAYADYIRGKKKGSENKTTVKGFQSKLGLTADGAFGSGDAVAMVAADVAPPAILYWPKALNGGPDALAKMQAAIALGMSNPQTKTSHEAWMAAYNAQAKSFSALYGTNAKPRKPTQGDLNALSTIIMAPELREAMSHLLQEGLQATNVSGDPDEIGSFLSHAFKSVKKAASSVAHVAVKINLPFQTVKAAANVARGKPGDVLKQVKAAANVGKQAVKLAHTVTKSPFVKVGAAGLAIICPPIGAPAVAAVAAINKGSELMSEAEKASAAATHMVLLAGKTVDALHNGNDTAKKAATTLIANTHKAASTPGPDQAGAMAGLRALAVAANTRSNTQALAKVSSGPPVVSMSGVLVADSGHILHGKYKAA
jgi:hypothetical protein